MRCFVCSTSTELQSWCMFSCFVTLFSDRLQTHAVIVTNLLLSCGFRSCIFCTACFSVSTLSSPLFPSPQLPSVKIDFCASFLSSCWFFKTSLEFHILKLCSCAESAHWDFWAQRLMAKVSPFPSPVFNLLSCNVRIWGAELCNGND